MKAAVLQNNQLVIRNVADPVPGSGDVLVKTQACGVCGSDLHVLHYCDAVLNGFRQGGVPIDFDPAPGVILGHEYCAEIVDYGPGTEKKLKPGTRVSSIPYIVNDRIFEHVGYSNRYPGGFGEYMLLPESLLVPVPDNLSSDIASLAEPLTVGVHAVDRAEMKGDEVPIVIGCGTIGLMVILALKAKGIGPIVAADFSPYRRELAAKLGADVVVDPAEQSPYQSWVEVAAPGGYRIDSPNALFGTGPKPRPCVVFECVGVPGVIQQMFASAPPRSRLIVVGVCMQPDEIQPSIGLFKQMDMRFSFIYSTQEFTEAVHLLAEGKVDAAPMVTGRVSVDELPGIIGELGNPEAHCKVVVTY